MNVSEAWRSLLIVVCLSGAAVFVGAWELVVTRMASVLYFYDLAYLAVALCLCGLGAGAIFARRYGARLRLRALLLALPAITPACWAAMAHSDLAWACLVFAIPFALFGAASTVAWHRLPDVGGRVRLYAGEVMGTVVGIVAVGPIVAAELPLDVLSDIGVETHLKAKVVEEGLAEHRSRTNAYARTDLVFTNRPRVAYLFTDAMFVTRSVRWDGESDRFDDSHVQRLARLKRLALRSASRDAVLLLGAGAGFDMTVALQEGSQHVDAVEVNPDTIAFARELDGWAGGVLANPRVEVRIAEARRFVLRSDKRWDQINLTLLQTSPASARGRSHVDARVLTVEAIRAYLDHLKPGGVIAIIQNTEELARRTYHTALTAVDGKAGRITQWQLPERQVEYNPFSHLLLVGKEAFDDGRIAALEHMAAELGVAKVDPRRIEPSRPATDDRPFLFESGVRMLSYIALAAVVPLIALMAISRRERRSNGNAALCIAAALVGAGSLGLQVLAAYRMQTALGSPAISMALTLAAAIGGAGLGALLLPRVFVGEGGWRRSGLLATCGVAAFAIAGPSVSLAAAAMVKSWAMLTSFVFTAACCLPLGLPFLAVMERSRNATGFGEGIPIGCDGFGGVIGASAASGIAIGVGFHALGICVVACFIAFALMQPSRASSLCQA